jgi:hypothetical protein
MPTTQYKNKKGERLSGGTTIIGNCGWKTTPLLIWKENQCIDAAIKVFSDIDIDFNVDLFSSELRKQIKEKSEQAPTAGTIVHYLIECDLKCDEPDVSQYPKESLDLAETSFLNYLQWRDSVHLEPIAIEPHLVSEKHQFGTTPDCIAKINGKPSVFEWKSGGIYEDYLLQLAEQKVIWEENNPEILLTGGFHLLEINKDTAAFVHHWWQVLPEAWGAFEACLKLHNLRKILKKQL